jgi:hypothetical protein
LARNVADNPTRLIGHEGQRACVEHEWKRAGLGFREALIPADVLNQWGTAELIREG